MIKFRIRYVEGDSKVRRYKTLAGARKWLAKYGGWERGSTYWVGNGGLMTCTILQGATDAELFAPEPKPKPVHTACQNGGNWEDCDTCMDAYAAEVHESERHNPYL